MGSNLEIRSYAEKDVMGERDAQKQLLELLHEEMKASLPDCMRYINRMGRSQQTRETNSLFAVPLFNNKGRLLNPWCVISFGSSQNGTDFDDIEALVRHLQTTMEKELRRADKLGFRRRPFLDTMMAHYATNSDDRSDFVDTEDLDLTFDAILKHSEKIPYTGEDETFDTDDEMARTLLMRRLKAPPIVFLAMGSVFGCQGDITKQRVKSLEKHLRDVEAKSIEQGNPVVIVPLYARIYYEALEEAYRQEAASSKDITRNDDEEPFTTGRHLLMASKLTSVIIEKTTRIRNGRSPDAPSNQHSEATSNIGLRSSEVPVGFENYGLSYHPPSKEVLLFKGPKNGDLNDLELLEFTQWLFGLQHNDVTDQLYKSITTGSPRITEVVNLEKFFPPRSAPRFVARPKPPQAWLACGSEEFFAHDHEMLSVDWTSEDRKLAKYVKLRQVYYGLIEKLRFMHCHRADHIAALQMLDLNQRRVESTRLRPAYYGPPRHDFRRMLQYTDLLYDNDEEEEQRVVGNDGSGWR